MGEHLLVPILQVIPRNRGRVAVSVACNRGRVAVSLAENTSQQGRVGVSGAEN